MTETSLLGSHADIQRAVTLFKLGARVQVAESETSLPKARLLRLYREVQGSNPPKGMLPSAEEWFMAWRHNIHASLFAGFYHRFRHDARSDRVDALISAYQMYLEQIACIDESPVLDFTRAWTLLRFFDCNILTTGACDCCDARFITYAPESLNRFVCGICQPPPRAKGRDTHPLRNSHRKAQSLYLANS